MFGCFNKYFTIFVLHKVTLCLLFICSKGLCNQAIETIPFLPDKALAFGYQKFLLKFNFANQSYTQCNWFSSNNRSLSIFTSFVSCQNHSDNGILLFNITCKNKNNTIFTSLTISVVNEHIVVNNKMTWNVNCGKKRLATEEIQIKECTVDEPLTVSGASSGRYSTNGTFNCSNNGELFYSNGTKLNMSQTTCLYTAKWSGSQELECWKAPFPMIYSQDTEKENVTVAVKEGNNLTLRCEYNNTYPPGNESLFYSQNEAKIQQRNTSFTIVNLTKDDNGKNVSCQAVTPLTLKMNDTGRSNNLTIIVQYPPFQNITTTCEWIINSNDTCNVTFYSKPNSAIIGLYRNDAEINFTNNLVIIDNAHQFLFQKSMVSENDSGYYILKVNSSFFRDPYKINFNINVALPPTTAALTRIAGSGGISTSFPTSSAALQSTTKYLDSVCFEISQEIIIICSVVGALTIVAFICYCVWKRQKAKRISEKDNAGRDIRDNELYASTSFGDNTEREMKVNEIYASTDKTENVKREMKDNELYASIGNNDVTKPPGSDPAAAYGIVKKPKKKEKKPNDSVQELKENEFYASTGKCDNTEREIKVNELYESTDNTKNVKIEIEDNELYSSTGNNDLTQPYGSDPTATYAVVNKPQKKKKTSITENNSCQPDGSDPTATYAVVNIAQKKKKA